MNTSFVASDVPSWSWVVRHLGAKLLGYNLRDGALLLSKRQTSPAYWASQFGCVSVRWHAFQPVSSISIVFLHTSDKTYARSG